MTIAEAVLGGKITAPTLTTPVTLTVPAHSDTGRVLRLRGRGIPGHGERAAGDLYVTLKIVAGPPDAELEAALKAWGERHSFNPRASMQEAT